MMGCIIGSWNLRTFTGDETKRDIRTMVEIIHRERFHVIALQEIMDTGVNIFGDEVIKSLAGKGWEYSFGNEDRPRFTREQYRLGFLWNPRYIEKCPNTGWSDKLTRMSAAGISRDPVYMSFMSKHGPRYEIRLINVHISYGSTEQERIEEFKQITGEMKNCIKAQTPIDNKTVYTIILGDYNLTALICNRNEGYGIVTKQDEKTTISNYGYSHDYDHFTSDLDLFSRKDVKPQRVDTVKVYMRGDFEQHKKMLSDHVPIKIEIK